VDDLDDHDDLEPLPMQHDDSIASETPGEKVGADVSPPTDKAMGVGQRSPEWQAQPPVLCIAGRGPLDEGASAMLAQLLQKHEIGVRSVTYEAVSRARIAGTDPSGVAMVCLSYLNISGSPAHLRFLTRRIKQRFPTATILVGIWPADDPFLRDHGSRQALGAEYYVSSLREALDICLAAAHDPGGKPTVGQSLPRAAENSGGGERPSPNGPPSARRIDPA
jgi:hypothetical protein